MKTVFKVGMKVYDQVLEPNKKGTIVEIKEGCLIAFPVSVQFENCTDIRSYTLDGRYNRNGEQTLSTKPYKIVYEGFEQKAIAPTYEEVIKEARSKGDYYYLPDSLEAPSEELADATKALLKLLFLRDYYNEGWQPDWNNRQRDKFGIMVDKNMLCKESFQSNNKPLAFKSREIRDRFFEEQRELLEIAKPLL